MDTNKIAYLAIEAGKIILENGGETYRVEETILRIFHAFGLKNADSFVTPTGIFISVSDKYGNTVSLVRRVKKRTVNLEKIIRVNDLSRTIFQRGFSSEDMKEELDRINNLPRYNKNITLLFSALAAGSFSLLFGGTFVDFIAAFFIGGTIKYVGFWMNRMDINDFFINILGGAIASFLAILCYYLNFYTNIDKIIIGSIMLLVPGLAITNAIRDTIAGDLVSGTTRAVEAFLIAVGIAIGTGTVLKIWMYITGGKLI